MRILFIILSFVVKFAPTIINILARILIKRRELGKAMEDKYIVLAKIMKMSLDMLMKGDESEYTFTDIANTCNATLAKDDAELIGVPENIKKLVGDEKDENRN